MVWVPQDSGAGKRTAVNDVQQQQSQESGCCRGDDAVVVAEVSFAALIRDVVDTHHAFLRRQFPLLQQLTTEAAEANAAVAPELAQLPELTANFVACVEAQLSREEGVLFPMIERLAEQTVVSPCHAGMIKSRISMAEREHARVHGVLTRMKDLTHRYLSPAGPCEACHELLGVLDAIERDLAAHVSKERGQLYPQAVEREAALARR